MVGLLVLVVSLFFFIIAMEKGMPRRVSFWTAFAVFVTSIIFWLGANPELPSDQPVLWMARAQIWVAILSMVLFYVDFRVSRHNKRVRKNLPSHNPSWNAYWDSRMV